MNTICGVDVSKDRLDVVIGADVSGQFANDADGIASLTELCRAHAVDLVVMEATGGYERSAYLLLWQAGLACAVVHPASVRHYALSMGKREKTDMIDAHIIADYAVAKRVVASQPPSERQSRLKALVRRLSQVSGDLGIQKQRLAMTQDDQARASLCELIAFLKRQMRTLEGEIASMIDDDPLWAKLAEAFSTVKAVAGRTIARLMADFPEIGLVSNKAAAKLVGLAPLANDSGERKGQRHIGGGRAQVRSILFLVAGLAARFDQTLRDFHRRLIDAGKPKMVARIALAHKLLVRLNAKARDARKDFANAP